MSAGTGICRLRVSVVNDIRETRSGGVRDAQGGPGADCSGPAASVDAPTAVGARACGRLPRLLKRREFLAAAAGRRVHSSRMTVQVFQRPVPATGEAIRGPRFGLTVTKKTANAVGRNRIRRRLRGLLCKLRPSWPQGDIDFVIVGRAEMLTAKPDVIEADLKRAFSSPPGQGNPRGRHGRAPAKGRGKGRGHGGGEGSGGTAGQGDARSHNAIQQDPTGGS